ncbi:hypothetical protein UlMin_002859 [Ulmus minor]
MASKHIFFLSLIFFSSQLYNSSAQTWIQAGYWYASAEIPVTHINSALFNHLICGFATVNNSTFQLSISSPDEQYYSNFTAIVRRKNPSITTLLSIWNGQKETANSILGERGNFSVLSSMLNQSSHRKSFIDSSIKIARKYGFLGIDLFWLWPNTPSDMFNMGILLDEWRASIESESRSSDEQNLILTMALHYSPDYKSVTYPIESMKRNLDWGHVVAYDYHLPTKENSTGAHAALYDPSSKSNTNYGINEWMSRGFPSNKLVLGLPFHGYAWTLANPKDSSVGAAASGKAETEDGSMSYTYIKWYVRTYGAKVLYNSTYVVNYCVIGATWMGYDDVEAIRTKIAYAKEKKLLGYNVFLITNDDNYTLSQAAHGEESDRNKQVDITAQEGGGMTKKHKRRFLLIILAPIAAAIFPLGFLLCFFRKRLLNSKAKVSKSLENYAIAAGDFNSNVPNLQLFSLAEIKAATEGFSIKLKLGEGGYGPVYKGLLPNGQEIAVKKLSKSSTQGFEEFKNEVVLTAKLQHVNLVKVLGFCIESDEQMLIYEYMPNKSLDLYLFDPLRRYILDWKKRVEIIEGVTQGLLYLQEYSRLTIIHRDLKASNILLDDEMKPKISDFGMARIFAKDGLEANTDRIVGTYGYVPPEYVSKGVYSTKSDVYSFGVLLLQIISGKKNAFFYGSEENLNLLEYAYELWKRGKGMEFMDPALDDTLSKCKLLKCLQIALLCVEENANDRPSMLEVSSMLKNENSLAKIPKKPAFSLRSKASSGTCSVNEITISEEVAR